jgi:hypothetical protein
MRYVIIRDDDTNALTPVDCLEQLYRPFLDRGFPVNLATIPNVRTDVKIPSGEFEGFLSVTPELRTKSRCETKSDSRGPMNETAPIGTHTELLRYLKGNPEYRIVHHGWQHDYFEFDRPDAADVARRLDAGRRQLEEAGLGAPRTFVAPYDKLSRAAMREVARRFRVLSTGWYELRRLPLPWWPQYLVKRSSQRPHWRVGETILLTHPGCLLSCHRNYADMLKNIQETISNQRLTVLVTHWWEYFRNGRPDSDFIDVLHSTASLLESDPEVRVISFDDLIDSKVTLN